MLNSVTIIPNDDILDVPVYFKEGIDISHHELAKDFYNRYNIPITSNNCDMDIPNMGHTLIKTWGDTLTISIHLPITIKQYNYILSLYNKLKDYKTFESYIWDENKSIYIYKLPADYPKTKVDYFYEILKKEYLESERVL